jgi:hypothetical protein
MFVATSYQESEHRIIHIFRPGTVTSVPWAQSSTAGQEVVQAIVGL